MIIRTPAVGSPRQPVAFATARTKAADVRDYLDAIGRGDRARAYEAGGDCVVVEMTHRSEG